MELLYLINHMFNNISVLGSLGKLSVCLIILQYFHLEHWHWGDIAIALLPWFYQCFETPWRQEHVKTDLDCGGPRHPPLGSVKALELLLASREGRSSEDLRWWGHCAWLTSAFFHDRQFRRRNNCGSPDASLAKYLAMMLAPSQSPGALAHLNILGKFQWF